MSKKAFGLFRQSEKPAADFAAGLLLCKHGGGEVALAGVGEDGDHGFAGVLRAGGEQNSGVEGGAGGDAGKDSLGAAQLPGGGVGLCLGDGEDLVIDAGIEDAGDKVGADALQTVGTGISLAQQGGGGGLHGDDLNIGLLASEISAGSGDGAAGTHTGHENVHLAVGIFPNLGAGGLEVGVGVGRVVELIGDPRAGDGVGQLLCLFDGGEHAAGAGGQHQLCAVGGHELLAFDAHGVGHDDDAAVAPLGADRRKADAGVAGGGLNNRGAGADDTALLGVIEHGLGHPIFGRAAGVSGLQLYEQTAAEIVGCLHAAQPQQGRAADERLGRGKNVGHD